MSNLHFGPMTLGYTTRNARGVMQVVDFYQLDVSLSSSCIKPVGFIMLNRICENQT